MIHQCQRCRLRKDTALWTCRNCGKQSCEHYCSGKKADKTATCNECKLVSAKYYALKRWFESTYEERTKAVNEGSTNISWAIPSYRVSWTEFQSKAEELGIKSDPVSLRQWARRNLRFTPE